MSYLLSAYYIGASDSDGGGGGLHFRKPADSFAAATLVAARTARDTYFATAAGIAALSAFQGDQSLAIILSVTGVTARTFETYLPGQEGMAYDNSQWVERTDAVQGDSITGAPGGGAIEPVGDILDGTASRPADEFIGTGIMLGERGATPYLAYRLVPNALALLWFSTDELYDIIEAAVGDTSTDGSGTIERNRLRMPEAAGSSISGSVDAGRTVDNELLISTTTANVDITVEFFRYISSVAQGGLTDAERTELNRLSGVETDAKDDQTGAEIKLLYESESDTNAFTDTEKANVASAAAANWVKNVTASGSTITITRRDGTVTQHTFPMGSGGAGDGVLDEAPVFNENAQTVTFHISTGATFTLNLSDLVTQTELDTAINGLQNQTNAEVKASYEANPNTNVYSNGEKTKLAGVFNGANQITPYKLGNIYQASASGTIPDKPTNNEGTATISGITIAPNDWQLARPEATAALPHVYDCHVYGYVTNGVFGVQYGTPNRTDRYIAPGGTGIDAATANGLIQAAFAAAVMDNTETGIAVTYNADGTLDFVVSGGGGGTPVPTDDIYFGTSVDDIPDPDELILAAVNGVVTIDAYVGNLHILIARLETEADITDIQRGDDVSNTNQIGAFTKFGMTVIPMDETLSFKAWVSNQALDQAANVEWSAS